MEAYSRRGVLVHAPLEKHRIIVGSQRRPPWERAQMNLDPEMKPRRNFRDLAKLAGTLSPQAERGEDSGVVHLATLEAAGGGTAAPSAPPIDVRTEAVSRDAPRLRPAVAGVVLLGTLALGAFFGSVGSTMIRRAPAGSHAALGRGQTTPPGARAPWEPSQAEALKLPLAPGRLEASETHETPAAEPSPPDTGPAGQDRARHPSPPSAHPSSAASDPPAQARNEDRPPPVPPQRTNAARSGKSLGEQIEEAAGGPAPSAVTSSSEDAAPSNPDGVVPSYPSLGAIHSALGRALQEAQACVDGDVAISHARVTFTSTGTVQAVTVTGWAAGKPAEDCVRVALTKPRVAPFLQATYVVPVTIRSN